MLKISAPEAKKISLDIKIKNNELSRLARVEASKIRKTGKKIIEMCEAAAYKGETMLPFEVEWEPALEWLESYGLNVVQQKNFNVSLLEREIKTLNKLRDNAEKRRLSMMRQATNKYVSEANEIIDFVEEHGYIPDQECETCGSLTENLLCRLKSIHRALYSGLYCGVCLAPLADKTREELRLRIRELLKNHETEIIKWGERIESTNAACAKLAEYATSLDQKIVAIESQLSKPKWSSYVAIWKSSSKRSPAYTRKLNWLAIDARPIFDSLSEIISEALENDKRKKYVSFLLHKPVLELGRLRVALPDFVDIIWLLDLINRHDGYGYEVKEKKDGVMEIKMNW